jgi:tetratricopeptide (TPR) repeat protein
MSDAVPRNNDIAPDEPVGRRQTKQYSGVFRDPVVRFMSYAAVGILILFLVTVISAIITGVLSPGGPRTLAEKQVAVSGEAVRKGSTDSAIWGDYIASLIASGQYARAKSVIADGRASLDDSRTADFTLAEARLYNAQKQYDSAIESADTAMKQMNDYQEGLLAAGGSIARGAQLSGLPDNYYAALLVKASAYRGLGEWEKAVEVYDLYLKDEPTAADILIDRGRVKVEAGDKTGAEKDFRAALEFIPDSAEALQGLESIGVAR